MPLEKLVERILRDAREHADVIRDDSLKTRAEMLAEAGEEAEERYLKLTTSARREAEDEKRRKITMASLDARTDLLEEKQALIKEAFDRAIRAMREMPREQYVGLVVGPLVETVGEIDCELILSPRDREEIGPEVVERANVELERSGKKGRVSLSEETRDIAGGFIARAAGIETNNSLEARLSLRRDEFEPRVVEILFGKGAGSGSVPGSGVD